MLIAERPAVRLAFLFFSDLALNKLPIQKKMDSFDKNTLHLFEEKVSGYTSYRAWYDDRANINDRL